MLPARTNRCLVIADDFTAGDGSQRLPNLQIDGLADKMNRPVGEEDIDPPWVPAARGGCCFSQISGCTREVELRPVVAKLRQVDQIRAGAVRARAGIQLTITGQINPVYAPQIIGGLLLRKAREVLAH